MRIIAGIAKGRNLLSPVGMGTRPTLDRIKESIFSIIQGRVNEANVFDVFSGTGSLGLEAVSRGAKKCYLNDKGAETFKLLSQNVVNLKFENQCQCLNKDSIDAIQFLSNKGETFDIIFIDPPYLMNLIPPAIEKIQAKSLLDRKGIIVTKIDSSEVIYTGSTDIELYDSRKYGNTTVCFYRYKELAL